MPDEDNSEEQTLVGALGCHLDGSPFLDPQPLQDPKTGRFNKGNEGTRERARRAKEPVDKATFRDEFVQGLIRAYRKSGDAGIIKALKEKPHDFMTLLSRIVNASESDVVVQRLVVMGFPVQPPADWVPELVHESDNSNAT